MSLASKLAQIPNISTNYIPRATATGFVNGLLYDNGTNVGIGTSSLSSWDSTFGALEFPASSIMFDRTAPNVYLLNNAYYDGAWKYKTTNLATALVQNNAGEFQFRRAVSGTANAALTWIESMRITSSGNVGIGTSSPTTYGLAGKHLELFGGSDYSFIHNNTTTVKSFYAINESALTAALFTFSNHPLAFGTNNTERMRITSGGNVLIGTSTDDGTPLLVGKPRTTDWQIKFSNGTALSMFSHGQGYGGYIDTGTDGNSSLRYIFKTVSGGVERFVVRGDGKTSLSSTASSFGQFQIGSANNNGEASIAFISGVSAFGDNPSSINGNNSIWAVGANVFGINGDNWGIGNKGTGSYVAKIAYNSTSWTFSSDIRLKNVIGNIENVLESVCKLNPVYYSWKSDNNNEKKLGFIAQEVYEQFPDIVDVPLVDKDEKGNQRYWGLNYGDLTPIIVKAIQEIKTEKDAEILGLKNQIEELKSLINTK